jgi:hypothetical protein
LRAQHEGERNHSASLISSFEQTSASILSEQQRGNALLTELRGLQSAVREESATRRTYQEVMQREIEMRMLLDQRIVNEVQAAERLENERAEQRDSHEVRLIAAAT